MLLYPTPSESLATNPFAEERNNKFETTSKGFLGNAALEWDIIDGLKYRFFAGADYSSVIDGDYIGSETYERSGGPHQANYRSSNRLSTIIDNVLSYKNTFDDKHRVDAVVGFSQETYRYRY